MKTDVLRITDASFGYSGISAVTGVTLQLYPSEAVALIGPNGSGKSTLLKALLGLSEHHSGILSVLGTSPAHARRNIGFLPQADTRNHELPVNLKQVVAMGLYHKLGLMHPLGKENNRKIQEALEAVDLGAHAHKRFGDLSGGQQQRAILARAIVSNPRILLLDEPFNGLDRPNRDRMIGIVHEMRARGTAVIVSTHDLEIAQRACSHVCLLDRRMVAFGPVETTLTLEHVAETFHDTTVEVDEHLLTTRHEITERALQGHLHVPHKDEKTVDSGCRIHNLDTTEAQ